MYENYQLCEISTEKMNQFLQDKKQGTFLQSGYMADLTKLNGQKAVCLALLNEEKNDSVGQIIAVGMFMYKKLLRFFQMAICLGGPILDYQDESLIQIYFQKVKRYFKKQGVIYLTINPWLEMGKRDADGQIIEEPDWSINERLTQAGFQYYGKSHEDFLKTPRWIFVKDLVDEHGESLKDQAALLKTYTAKTRNHINKAKKNLITVRAVGKEKLPEFVELLDSTAERRGFHSRDQKYFENFLVAFKEHVRILMAFLEPPKTLLHLEKLKQELLAEKKESEIKLAETNQRKLAGKIKDLENQIQALDKSIQLISPYRQSKELPISAALFIDFNTEMVYFLSGSTEEFFGLCGADLIQMHAQTLAIEKGLKSYNYFGTYGHFSGNQDEGVYRFKKSFGNGRVIELPGLYYQALHPIWGRIAAYRFSPKQNKNRDT